MAYTVRTFDRLDDAAGAVAADRQALFLGGGTLVMRSVNEGDPSFRTVVRATDRSLRQIRLSSGRVEIGAAATMSDILASRDAAFLHPAARAVGGPAIRNMATVGGNLFARSPYGDFTAALLALEATVSTVGGMGGRDMALAGFLAQRDGGQAGLVASVSVSRPSAPDAFRFAKVSRVKPKGISVLSIAAHLPVSGGRVSRAAVAYGAMAPAPIRIPAVERALEGRTLDEAGIAGALAAATEGCAPATDAIASEWYRREVAPVYLKRLLLGHTR